MTFSSKFISSPFGSPDLTLARRASTDDGPEQVVLQNVSVMTEGVLLGHDLNADETTLRGLVDLGNAAGKGVLSRFGHPTACDDALGASIGRMRNFRFVEASGGRPARVAADLHLANYASGSNRGDLKSYVENLANEDPDAAGFSISAYKISRVAKREVSVGRGRKEMREVVLSSPDDRMKGADGRPEPLYLRLASLDFVDLVAEPAANPHGVFASAGELPDEKFADLFAGTPAELAARATVLVDRFLASGGSIDRVLTFLASRAAVVRPDAVVELSERGSSVPPSTERKEPKLPIMEDTASPTPSVQDVEALRARVLELERSNSAVALELAIARSGFSPEQIKALELSGAPHEMAAQLGVARRAFALGQSNAPVPVPVAASFGIGTTPAGPAVANVMTFSPEDVARARGGRN